MKRIAILLAVVALFASTATIALANDDVDTDEDVKTESVAPEEFNEAETQKLDALAGFLVADPSAAGAGGEAEAAEEAAEKAAFDEIVELRYGEDGTGWGAIFKILQLAKASDMTLSELLDAIAEDEGGWAFGRRFKDIDEPVASAEIAPKNFGQLKKQERSEKSNNGKKPNKP